MYRPDSHGLLHFSFWPINFQLLLNVSSHYLQLIGVSVTGLEPEFQPVATYLLPNIISHKQDAHDMHLQVRYNNFCTHLYNIISVYVVL